VNSDHVFQLFYVGQLVYLLSLRKFFITYFSNSFSSGLVLDGVFSKYLSRKNTKYIYICWIASNILALFGSQYLSLISAITIFIFSRYFFIYLRYKSIGRGNGAPGFMSYWTIKYSLYFQIFTFLEIDFDLIFLVMKIDFAMIMLSAGYYKQRTGYLRGRGIEYGLRNKMWSWAYVFFTQRSNSALLFKILNFASIGIEYLLFVSLLVPGMGKFAGIQLLVMFFFLLVFVRLGTLPVTMFLLSIVIFFSENNSYQLILRGEYKEFAIAYILLLALSIVWNWIFFFKVKIPFWMSWILRTANLITGSLIWSVFSASLTENFIEIVRFEGTKEFEVRGKDYGVHSGITLTTIATYTNYFPASKEIQELRLLHYLKCLFPGNQVLFVRFKKLKLTNNGNYYSVEKSWKFDSAENTLLRIS